MTDEQIKALECCNGYDCETCRALKYCDYMHPGALARASLDLINRQKAEIERLKKEVEDKERAYNDEFCLRKEWQSKCRELLEEKQTTKSEAIKAFAEKLKKRFYLCAGQCVVDVYHIDNLVKEMTEPSADVEEVRHGKWINDGDCFHCSVCNKTYQLGSLQTIYDVRRCWKYCANCGAKMDKE